MVLGLSAIATLYLQSDRPFPGVSTDDLTCVSNESIPKGKSVQMPGDSIAKNITTQGEWFVDRTGRAMILHGINVSGSTKVPYSPRLGTHTKEGFYETVYTASFTGRPFPLSEADEHFGRLHRWGYRFVRLLVTWEAIEHAGPGKYDEEYLDYVVALVKKAGEHGINVFIDPHQDVWSRFSGGDGAPYWTLEKVGFDPLKFSETGAAIIHNVEGDPFPKMIWPTNYSKLAAATMFTLFFGGNDFAPDTRVDSLSAQEFLQRHYIQAIVQLAQRLKGLPNVIGFDTLNEPSAGYIGNSNLEAFGILVNGIMPTPFQGMVAGAGHAVEVGEYEFAVTGPREVRRVQLNPSRLLAWKDAGSDIWRKAGVWGYDAANQPVLLKPDYFVNRNGRAVNFSEDYFKPFALRYQQAIHAVDSSWLIFNEAALFTELPRFSAEESRKMVNAGHWYDAITLLTKSYSSWVGVDVRTRKPLLGRTAIRKAFHDQMSDKKKETVHAMGQRPTLVGEFGIPFDMQEKAAFRTGDFTTQAEALDRSFRAMESNLLNYTLWNYTADNDNTRGDQWNGEDLSIFSLSQKKSASGPDAGGRALEAAIRPYAFKVAGEPLAHYFDYEEGEYVLRFHVHRVTNLPTEIFVPDFHFGKGFDVWHSPGQLAFDEANDLLLFTSTGVGEQVIVIRKRD